MKEKTIEEIKDENRRHHLVYNFLCWLIFASWMLSLSRIFSDDNFPAFLVWLGVTVLVYILLIFFVTCFTITGSLNFFKFFMSPKPTPVVKPLVTFLLVKMLDEYKIGINPVGGYHEYLNTNKAGLDKFLSVLNKRDVRFVRIPEIVGYSSDVKHKTINIDNIGLIEDVQQSETKTGFHDTSPKEAEKTISEYLDDGYVLTELKAVNPEAEYAVERLKKKFRFKGDD